MLKGTVPGTYAIVIHRGDEDAPVATGAYDGAWPPAASEAGGGALRPYADRWSADDGRAWRTAPTAAVPGTASGQASPRSVRENAVLGGLADVVGVVGAAGGAHNAAVAGEPRTWGRYGMA